LGVTYATVPAGLQYSPNQDFFRATNTGDHPSLCRDDRNWALFSLRRINWRHVMGNFQLNRVAALSLALCSIMPLGAQAQVNIIRTVDTVVQQH
jgi:hypothetical protein